MWQFTITDKWILYVLVRNMFSGCQKSCPLLFFFLHEALEHPHKHLVQLQITVRCIFTAYVARSSASNLPFIPHCWAERLFIFRFSHSSCHALWKTQERESSAPGKCLPTRWKAFAAAGQQWPWDYSGATVELSLFWKWSRPEASFTAATPSVPSLKESKQPAGAITWHISIQFPLQNVFIFRLMACHFAGAFGQELILESKQIFRGAIFHQVLIFFTLTEPVLPNLTWQPAAQWTGSTLASHRGSSPPPPSLHEVKERLGRRKKKRLPDV